MSAIRGLPSELNFDRSSWQVVKFGDVAIQQKKSVDRENTHVGRYVKGEHMSSEDLHLREWGELKDEYLGPAFIRYFEKGDLLYGSRRTYLRKVTIAPFEGITSNTTFVIKANESIIDKRLLPYVMLSEGFSQHSIRNSKGSVNPYVNWKDLAKYEFRLPPMTLQMEVADLLWTKDKLIQNYKRLLEKANCHYLATKNRLVLKGSGCQHRFSESLKQDLANGWCDTNIGDLLARGFIDEVQDGNHGDIHPKSTDYSERGIPFVMANCLHNGAIVFDKTKKLPKEKTDRLRIGFAKSGDVLLSHKGTVGEVALVPENIEWPYLMLTPQVTYYRVNSKKLASCFLYYVFTSSYFQNQLRRQSSQSTRAYVGITAQKKLKIAIPEDMHEQLKVVELLSVAEQNLSAIRKQIDTSLSLIHISEPTRPY